MSSHRSVLLPRRQLQALDLRTNYGEPRYDCLDEEFSDGDPRQPPITPRTAAYMRLDQRKLQDLRFSRINSSSDPSISQTISRSWSMIDLQTPRGTHAIRLRGGADTYAYDNHDEEARKFYRSMDPSVEYDEVEYPPIPPRNNRRSSIRRLRAAGTSLPGCDPQCPGNYRQNNGAQTPNYSSFVGNNGGGGAGGRQQHDNIYESARQPCPNPMQRRTGPAMQSTPFPAGSPMRQRPSSYSEHYASLPVRPHSISEAPCPSWIPPNVQTTPRQSLQQQQQRSFSAQRGYSQSNGMWDPSRQQSPAPPPSQTTNQYGSQQCANSYNSSMQTPTSMRIQGLRGRPMPAPSPPAQATWLTPPGLYYSGSMQQTCGPMQSQSPYVAAPMQGASVDARWDRSTMPPALAQAIGSSMDAGATCPPKEKEKEPEKCPPKDRVPFSCGIDIEDESSKPRVPTMPMNPQIAARMNPNLPCFNIPPGTEEEFSCMKRREQWETLVKDQYCPGAIQDTVDGIIDFNVHALDIVFGNARLPECLPRVEPLTLMEAFCMRINFERCQVRKLEEATRNEEDGEESKIERSNDCSIIDKCFKRKHQSELNSALCKLLKAEKMHDYLNPDPEQPSMDMMVSKTTAEVPGIPIVIQAFTGTTQPLRQ